MRKKKEGFTLAELLIVVAIIAVLVAISIPIFTSQLEKSRRAVDLANARDIVAVFAAAVNSGTMEIPDKDSTVWVEIHREKIWYGKGTEDNSDTSSNMARINGVAINNQNRDTVIPKLLKDSGINVDNLRVRCKNANENWTWYVVCVRGNGTIYVRSGEAPNSDRIISDNKVMKQYIDKTDTKIQSYFD